MATIITANQMVSPGDLSLNAAANPGVALGARVFDQAGNAYRFVRAGGTALVPARLQQASAQVANHQNLAVATTAAQSQTLAVTLGATAATANQYAGGWVVISAGTGIGQRLLISSHPAADASASLTLTLSDPLGIATAVADSKADLIANPYSGAIIAPASASSGPVGVAVTAVAAGNYGFVQSGGIAACLADGAITTGTSLSASNGTAGAVEPAAGVQSVVAQAITDIATTEVGAINVDLP